MTFEEVPKTRRKGLATCVVAAWPGVHSSRSARLPGRSERLLPSGFLVKHEVPDSSLDVRFHGAGLLHMRQIESPSGQRWSWQKKRSVINHGFVRVRDVAPIRRSVRTNRERLVATGPSCAATVAARPRRQGSRPTPRRISADGQPDSRSVVPASDGSHALPARVPRGQPWLAKGSVPALVPGTDPLSLPAGSGVQFSLVPGPVGSRSRLVRPDRWRADPNIQILPERAAAHIHARQRVQRRGNWTGKRRGWIASDQACPETGCNHPDEGATHHAPPLR